LVIGLIGENILKRAIRRYHKQRIVAKTIRWMKITGWWPIEPQDTSYSMEDAILQAKRMADNAKACSCDMCGNPRKYYNEKNYTRT